MTSCDETFWLIPAIRKKERSGPGMIAVADEFDCDPGASEAESSEPQSVTSKTTQVHRTLSDGRRRGDFTAGTLLEPSGASTFLTISLRTELRKTLMSRPSAANTKIPTPYRSHSA